MFSVEREGQNIPCMHGVNHAKHVKKYVRLLQIQLKEKLRELNIYNILQLMFLNRPDTM